MTDLTEAEAAVYDRQLRVWGVEVQKRLRSARVLIVGCTGLAAEVAKNIVLAGVGQLSLLDDTASLEAEESNFLNCPADPNASVAEVCARSLTEMNPMVSTSARGGPASPSRETISGFDVCLVAGRPLGSLVLWDTLCRDNGVAFFGAVSRGTHAFFFTDLGSHTFQPPEVGGKLQETRSMHFHTLVEALQTSWKGLHATKTHKLLPILLLCATKEGELGDFLPPTDIDDTLALGHNLAKTQGAPPKIIDRATLADYLSGGPGLAPVNAVVGGVLANEVLKAVSKRGEPLDNLFLYGLADGGGLTERLAPPVKEVKVMSELAKQV